MANITKLHKTYKRAFCVIEMKQKMSLKEINATRNHAKFPWNMRVLSYASLPFSYIFINFLPFTANQITFMWGILALVGIFFIALGGYWNFLIGIIIFQFSLLIDHIDGSVARARKNSTIGGLYLDFFWHYIHRALLMLALGIGLFVMTKNTLYFYLGIWCSFLFLFDNITKLKVYETMLAFNRFDLLKKKENLDKTSEYLQTKDNLNKKLKIYIGELMRPNQPFSLIFWAILFNLAIPYLIFMSIVLPFIFIDTFIKVYLKIGNLPLYKDKTG